MKALVGAFNQEEALVGGLFHDCTTGCETDGSICGTRKEPHNNMAELPELCRISGFLVILSILYCCSESLPKDFANTHSFVDNE